MKEPIKYNYNMITMVFAGTEVDKELLYSGELLYYHTDSIMLFVKLNSPSEDAIPIFTKEQITAPFQRLYFTPSGAGTITLYLANPKEIKIESRLVNVDTVQLLNRDDAFRYYTDQEKAFIGGLFWVPAASNYCLIELFNPVGSGKVAYILAVRILQVVNLSVYLNQVTTQLTSPTALTKTNKSFKGSPVASVINLQRKDDTTAPTITALIDMRQQNSTGTYAISVTHPNSIDKDPIKLAEGYGLRASCTTVALGMGCFFEWIEI
jgi:hypothetical protein